MRYTKQQINEQLDRLPRSVEYIAFSQRTNEAMRALTDEHGLHTDTAAEVYDEIVFVLVGLERARDFTTNLREHTRIPEEKVNALARSADQRIFTMVREELSNADEEAERETGTARPPAAQTETPPAEPEEGAEQTQKDTEGAQKSAEEEVRTGAEETPQGQTQTATATSNSGSLPQQRTMKDDLEQQLAHAEEKAGTAEQPVREAPKDAPVDLSEWERGTRDGAGEPKQATETGEKGAQGTPQRKETEGKRQYKKQDPYREPIE